MATVGNITNPFSVTSYIGPEYFCGRETESEALFSALFNRRNVTLISKRKLGKTGLIHHFLNNFSKKEAFCFYILVSTKQKELLKAIAHEGYVKEIMSKDFLNRYQLGAASTVSAAAQVLTDKELVYLSDTGEYSIYNPFFAIYLRS